MLKILKNDFILPSWICKIILRGNCFLILFETNKISRDVPILNPKKDTITPFSKIISSSGDFFAIDRETIRRVTREIGSGTRREEKEEEEEEEERTR